MRSLAKCRICGVARLIWESMLSQRKNDAPFLCDDRFSFRFSQIAVHPGSLSLCQKCLFATLRPIASAQEGSYRLQKLVAGKWPLQHGVRS